MGLPSTNAWGYREGSPVHFVAHMKKSQNLLVRSLPTLAFSITSSIHTVVVVDDDYGGGGGGGGLKVIHGTGDDNCHYQGAERLINELVRLNKPFQMLAYPNRHLPCIALPCLALLCTVLESTSHRRF